MLDVKFILQLCPHNANWLCLDMVVGQTCHDKGSDMGWTSLGVVGLVLTWQNIGLDMVEYRVGHGRTKGWARVGPNQTRVGQGIGHG
jgi:hypothetical protein